MQNKCTSSCASSLQEVLSRHGEEVDLIEKNNIIKGAESVTQAILQKWLTSDAPTRTYQHLIECLRQSELGALAELIANTTVGEGMLMQDLKKKTSMFLPSGHSIASRVTEQISTVAQNDDSIHTPLVLSCNSTAQQETLLTTNLTDPLTSYASYLKELYTSMSQNCTSQHWGYLPRCEFIQLAMIGSGELRRGGREEEMVRLAQQGRIETILDHKKPIDLESLFPIPPNQPLVLLPPPPRPRVLLIEGAPGGGKSTLVLHICHKWTQDDFSFGRFDLVILVYLRDQAIQNATTLADILPARTLEISQMVATKIQASDGKNVLFVFDGWDEFPHDLQKKSLVSTIIRKPHKLSLHQSTVLITSRPVSSGNLLHIADRRVEILGFTQHQIREYIEKALDGNSTHIQKLVQHLEEHPVIEGYCYVPLHVAILVHIFLTMKGALPTTLHELFCNLVLCCIVRELDTHESESDTSEVHSLDDLPDDLKSKLSNLSMLAYEGVMQNKVVFYRDDLRKFNLPANLPTLGLLQAVEGLTLFNKSLSYNFLHLSVQELLAAYYISHMDSNDQVEVFKQMFGGFRFKAVLYYYSGFTKLADPVIRDFISTYSQQRSSFEDLLPFLHCFYEAQEPSLCMLVASQFPRNIRINSLALSPIDLLAIGYSVASLSSDVQIHLTIEEVDEHRFKLFLVELSKYIVRGLPTTGALSRTLQLDLSRQSLSNEKVALLASHLRQSPIITNLGIKLCHFRCDIGLLHLWEALQTNSSLTELHITHGQVHYKSADCDCLALKSMLQVNKSLSHLDFSKTSGFSLETRFIFQGLQLNTSLVHLNLSNIGPVVKDAAQALTTMLQVNKTLTHLDLSSNQLSDSVFTVSFKVFSTIQPLVS